MRWRSSYNHQTNRTTVSSLDHADGVGYLTFTGKFLPAYDVAELFGRLYLTLKDAGGILRYYKAPGVLYHDPNAGVVAGVFTAKNEPLGLKDNRHDQGFTKPTFRGILWDNPTKTMQVDVTDKLGYHTSVIPRGVLGEWSKVKEEFLEVEDARLQGNKVMELVELADMVCALGHYLDKHYKGVTVEDLVTQAEATNRAFAIGERKSRP